MRMVTICAAQIGMTFYGERINNCDISGTWKLRNAFNSLF